MADDTLKIELELDESTLSREINKANSMLAKGFNNVVINVDTKKVTDEINNIDKKLKALNDSKQILLKAEQTPETKKVLGEIEKRISSLTQAKTINIGIKDANTTSLKTIEKKIKELTEKRNEVILQADTKKASKELKEIDEQLDRLETSKKIKIQIDKKNLDTINKSLDSIGKAGVIALAGVATASVATGASLFKLATMASDAQEATSKLYNVFNDVAKQDVSASIDKLVSSYGFARAEAEELLGSTGNVLSGIGLVGSEALNTATEIQKLSADLVSFTNYSGGVTGASEAITKAFLGEREALKSLGIAISEEEIKHNLLEKGYEGLTGESERLAKAQATLEIIYKKSNKALGDYERTSQGFANQQRLTSSLLNDLGVTIGDMVLPYIEELAIKFNQSLVKITEFVDDNDALKASFENLTKSISNFLENGLNDLIENLPKVINDIGKFIDFIGAVIRNIDIIIPVLGGLTASFIAVKGAILLINAELIAFNALTGGIILAIGAIVMAYLAYLESQKESNKYAVEQTDELSRQTKEIENQISSVKKLKDEMKNTISTGDSLASSLSELTEKYKETGEGQEEIAETAKQLQKIYPELELIYKDNGDIIGYNVEQYEELKRATIENTKAQVENALAQAKASSEALKALESQILAKRNAEALTVAQLEASFGGGALTEGQKRDLELARKPFEQLSQAYSETRAEAKKTDLAIEELSKEVIDYANQLNEIGKENLVVDTGDDKPKGTTTEKPDIQQELNKRLKQEKDFLSAKKDLLEQSILDEVEKNERIYEAEQESYKQRQKLIEQSLKDQYEATGSIEGIEVSQEASITGDITPAIDEYNKLAESIVVVQEETQTLAEYMDGLFGASQFDGLVNGVEGVKDAFQDLTKDSADSIVKFAANTVKLGLEVASAVGTIWSAVNDLQEAKMQAELQSLQENYDSQVKKLEEKNSKENDLLKEQLESQDEINKEHQEMIDELEAERDELEAQKKAGMSEADYNELQKKINDKNDQIEAEKKALKDAEKAHAEGLKNQQANDEAYELKKEELDRKYANEKAKIERKQAEESRKLQLFEASIAMASAIAQAVVAGMKTGLPLVFIPIFTALAATQGALQIAAINSQPLPSLPAYSKGGIVGGNEGNYRAFGLTPPNSQDNQLAWLSTGERVLTAKQNQMYENNIYGQNTATNNYNISIMAQDGMNTRQIAKAVVREIGGRM